MIASGVTEQVANGCHAFAYEGAPTVPAGMAFDEYRAQRERGRRMAAPARLTASALAAILLVAGPALAAHEPKRASVDSDKDGLSEAAEIDLGTDPSVRQRHGARDPRVAPHGGCPVPRGT
jgi:hypothetical protein